MKLHTANPTQLGFDSLLTMADEDNDRRAFFKVTGHLPGTWEEALPYYRTLLTLHHAAMLDANEGEVIRLRGEAEDLATKLNGGTTFGICAPDGSGKRLETETATTGETPLWGQAGSFVIDHDGVPVRIEMSGLFGIGRIGSLWPSFTIHAVDRLKLFFSETGFRSFSGCGPSQLVPGQTPEDFVQSILTEHLKSQLRGKLVKVKPERKA